MQPDRPRAHRRPERAPGRPGPARASPAAAAPRAGARWHCADCPTSASWSRPARPARPPCGQASAAPASARAGRRPLPHPRGEAPLPSPPVRHRRCAPGAASARGATRLRERSQAMPRSPAGSRPRPVDGYDALRPVGTSWPETLPAESTASNSGSLRLRGDGAGVRSFAPVPACLVRAGDERAVPLRVLLEQVRLAALRAGAGDRTVPGGELAGRVVHAAVEALAESGLALGEPAAAIGADDALQGDGPGGLAGRIVRAGEEPAEAAALVQHRLAARGAHLVGRQILDHADLALLLDEVLGVLAVRIARAGQEAAHAAPLDHHRAAALLAHQIGGLLLALHVAHLRFRRLEALLERLVELAHHGLPVDLPFLDLVQLLLHPRRELHVHHAREGAEKQLGHDLPQVGGEEAPLLLLHVFLVLDGGEDRGIGRRTADALLLELLHQGRFGEPRRRLSEVLLGEQVDQLQCLTGLERRELARDVALLLVIPLHLLRPGLFRRLLRFLAVHREATGEVEDLARGAEGGPSGLDVRCGLVEDRRNHLAGDEAVPDQFVEAEHVLLQEGLYALRRILHRSRPDGLVGVLGALLRLELDRFGGEIILAPALPDVSSRARHRVGGEAHRVGAHVRDQSGLTLLAQLDALVETLRQGHRLLGGEAQAVRRVLLQLGGDERWRRVAPALLLRHLGHHELLAPERFDQRPRDLAGRDLRLLPVEPDELRPELRRQCGPQIRLDAPVLDRNELRDLLLALHHQPHRHALDAAGGEAAADLLPEDRRDLVAAQPIQHAARLLRVVQVAVQLQRILDRFLDGLLGDLVEEDALRGDLGPLQLLVHVPGDGFTLAIGVGREQQAIRGLRGRLQVRHYLLLRLDHFVDRPEAVFDVHADLALRQVHHVADRRLHHVSGAEVLLDGLRLGR